MAFMIDPATGRKVLATRKAKEAAARFLRDQALCLRCGRPHVDELCSKCGAQQVYDDQSGPIPFHHDDPCLLACEGLGGLCCQCAEAA